MAIPKEVKKFADVNIGDELSSFTIDETQETIDAAVVRLEEDGTTEPSKNIHNDPEFAKEGIFSTTVNGGVITMSYIAQMLEQDFPRESFFDGGSMLFKAIEPFRPVDTVTFTGSVTGKRQEDGKNLIDCKIIGTNQKGQLIGVAESTLNLE